MKELLEKGIKVLLQEMRPGVKADDALKFTQAALNMAHIMHNLDKINFLKESK